MAQLILYLSKSLIFCPLSFFFSKMMLKMVLLVLTTEVLGTPLNFVPTRRVKMMKGPKPSLISWSLEGTEPRKKGSTFTSLLWSATLYLLASLTHPRLQIEVAPLLLIPLATLIKLYKIYFPLCSENVRHCKELLIEK